MNLMGVYCEKDVHKSINIKLGCLWWFILEESFVLSPK